MTAKPILLRLVAALISIVDDFLLTIVQFCHWSVDSLFLSS